MINRIKTKKTVKLALRYESIGKKMAPFEQEINQATCRRGVRRILLPIPVRNRNKKRQRRRERLNNNNN